MAQQNINWDPSISKLLKSSVENYTTAIKAGFIFIILAVLVQDAYLHVGRVLSASSLLLCKISFLTGVSLLSLFFWSCTLYVIHQALVNRRTSVALTLLSMVKKMPHLIVVAVLYVGLFTLSIFWLQFLSRILALSDSLMAWRGLINLLLVGLPLLVIFLLFLLSIPIVVVSKNNVIKALGLSAKLVWRSRLKSTFVFYLGIMVLFYLSIPGTLHAKWLMAHHVKIIFDLVIFLIFAPVLSVYLSLLLKEFKITQ